MKISGPGEARGLGQASRKRPAQQAGDSKFAGHLAPTSTAAPTEVATGAGGIAALLAVQAAGDALEGRRQAYDRAESLLKRLDAIRVAMLEGRMDADALRRLIDDLSGAPGDMGDPALAELVAEIELRAHVELAKLGIDY